MSSVRGCPCSAAAVATLPLPATAAPAVTVETAAQEIVGTRDPNRPHAPDQGAAAARPGAVPARHRQPWLARTVPSVRAWRCPTFSAVSNWLLQRGYMVALPLRRGYGRDRRSLAGKLRIVQQPRLLSGRDDARPRTSKQRSSYFPWPTRGAARPYSPDRPVGGRLGIARARQPESGRRVRGPQFRRRAGGGHPKVGNCAPQRLVDAASPLWLDRPHSRALALRGQRFVSRLISARKMSGAFVRAGGRAEYVACRPSAATGIGCWGCRRARAVAAAG